MQIVYKQGIKGLCTKIFDLVGKLHTNTVSINIRCSRLFILFGTIRCINCYVVIECDFVLSSIPEKIEVH